MKTYTKTIFRLLKKQITRFLTIIAIVIVSVGFMSGIGEVEQVIKKSTNDYYISQNVSDLYLKSKKPMGFSIDEINWIEKEFGKENIMKSFCYETKVEEDIIRIYNFDLDDMHINNLELLEGRLPKLSNEILVERETTKIKGYELNEKVNIQGIEFTVCGIVLNPLILNQVEEPSFQYENQYLNNVIYMHTEEIMFVNDIYVTLDNRSLFDAYDSKYEDKINQLKNEIEIELGKENVSVLSLYENFGLYSLISYAEKVGLIGIVFVVFFILVTLLVVYSTMTRLLDEERSQIACLKTLGYSNFKIISKYLIFVLLSSIIGGLLSYGVGLGLTHIIYSAFNLQYYMPPFPNQLSVWYYLATFAIIIVSTVLLILFASLKLVDNKPVTLLTSKAPKSGKKVLLEKITFIWKMLSFKYKSTFRNVFLFKSRFLMTVVSIIGSTVLVFAGMGLMDCSSQIEGGSSLVTISTALIIFSAILCALVIYNITNINISERNREVATLMVLGYHDNEVTGYIYREIYIMSFIGALLGIPFGYLFIEFVFNLIDFGSVSDINWWTWVLTPIITMVFSFISTLLLRKKIIRIDMNTSLKSIE